MLVNLVIAMFASPYFIKVVQLPPRIVGVGILVIGSIFEVQFRRGKLIGGWSYFVGRPVAIGLFLVTIVLS